MTLFEIIMLILLSPLMLLVSIFALWLVMGPIGVMAQLFFPNSRVAKFFEENMP